MKNEIKKIFAGLMLTAFVFANTAVSAMQDESYIILTDDDDAIGISRPQLRTTQPRTGDSLKLKGDVTITAKNSPVTLSLRDSDVIQVLRMFADKAGLNIILHPEIKDQTVTLDLVNVPLNKAFDMVLEITELTYVMDGNTIIIAPTSVKGFNMAKQDMTSIPVKYVDAATIAAFLNKNIYGINKPGISGDEIAVTNPATNELLIFGTRNEVAIAKKIVEKFDRKPSNVTFKVNHTTPAQMADMICKRLLPNALGTGDGSTGGAAGISGSATGAAIALNEGTIACTVAAKATAGAITSPGFQSLSIAYYSSLGTIDIMGGSEEQIEMIRDFIKQTDKKHPQAYLEVSIIELSESGSKTLENTWKVESKYFSGTFADGVISPQPFEWQDGTFKKFTEKSAIKYTINYLVENKKGRVVANPRILITNGQSSTIDLTSDYVKTVKSEVVQGNGISAATQRTYEIGDDNGIKIEITPFISPDGYVTLDIAPDYSTIKERIYSGSNLEATLLQRRNLDLKSVRIKDGETLVIGGMIREDETKSVRKVPGLGDVPYLGALFRSAGNDKAKEEMIIMITPKIIADSKSSRVEKL